MADVKYLTGDPDLSASMAGRNEFSPGEEVVLKVNIENRGLIEMKFVRSGIVERDDLPSTAKLVKAGLFAGDSPLVIKADPQMVGDIPGGETATVSFAVKIPADAMAGNYTLPLHVHYLYLKYAEQYGQDAISYTYREMDETLDLPIRIRPKAMLEVTSISGEHLNAGTEGYLALNVRNRGSEDAKDAVLRITRNGNSPVIPTDSSLFVGDFPAGGSREARFKVAISRDAGEGAYPLDLSCLYTNSEGDTVSSDLMTIGVPVGGKIQFSVVSPPSVVHAGEKPVIEVEYQNTGSALARHAQARISAVDPFTSNDDSAYLGDLAPGEKAIARYEVNVGAGATAKEYGLDSEIRYRDALDNSAISDTMKVRVRVEEGGISPLLIVGILILLACAGGAGYYILKKRK
ncbi:MAG: S-layer protein [Methanolinea sp.]|nr:S-layer protein [Methanolinea sp.]